MYTMPKFELIRFEQFALPIIGEQYSHPWKLTESAQDYSDEMLACLKDAAKDQPIIRDSSARLSQMIMTTEEQNVAKLVIPGGWFASRTGFRLTVRSFDERRDTVTDETYAGFIHEGNLVINSVILAADKAHATMNKWLIGRGSRQLPTMGSGDYIKMPVFTNVAHAMMSVEAGRLMDIDRADFVDTRVLVSGPVLLPATTACADDMVNELYPAATYKGFGYQNWESSIVAMPRPHGLRSSKPFRHLSFLKAQPLVDDLANGIMSIKDLVAAFPELDISKVPVAPVLHIPRDAISIYADESETATKLREAMNIFNSIGFAEDGPLIYQWNHYDRAGNLKERPSFIAVNSAAEDHLLMLGLSQPAPFGKLMLNDTWHSLCELMLWFGSEKPVMIEYHPFGVSIITIGHTVYTCPTYASGYTHPGISDDKEMLHAIGTYFVDMIESHE